ncbi:MAG: DUF4959 domain-containing protein [Prevotellaceae bacterium]|jgi:hypothetical protein|nr:DUF4959 domain-containing protein [Prevotellaceae bacterium]
MNKIKTYLKYLCFCALIVTLFNACEEGERFKMSSEDNVPPAPPTNLRTTALNGGIRIHYTIPRDEDLMSIEAKCGDNTFAVSFYTDSIDVRGLFELKEYTVEVYALDKAGNKSQSQEVRDTPLESAISKIAKTFNVLPGFNGFVINWKNEMEETVNIFAEYEFMQEGVKRELLTIFSSRDTLGFAIVGDLVLSSNEQVRVKVSAGDNYNNRTEAIDKGSFTLLYDEEINHFNENGKNLWTYPVPFEEPPFGGGVVQAWGDEADGRTEFFIDGIIDDAPNTYNYTFCSNPAGYTTPYWNFLIDLGDYYELSRVVVHPRHDADIGKRGDYFTEKDVGIFAAYIWNEDAEEWEELGVYKNLLPEGNLSDLQWYRLGKAGHMHYLYPYDPKFTKSARWFRFECRNSFGSNYTSGPPPCLSEIRLFSKPK